MPRGRVAKKPAPEPMLVDEVPGPEPMLVDEAPAVVRKGKRRAENGSEDNPGGVIAPPTKSARTALGKSKQATVNGTGEGASPPPEVPKANGKGVARTASVRGRKPAAASASSSQGSSSVATPTAPVTPATLFCFGTNDCGQLGFECEKRKYPALVPELQKKKIKALACGGMHTIVLEDNGQVWSFGLNDDKALGRHTEDEEECFEPGRVQLPKKAIGISAGDSHSAALTEDGKVYAWGCFKDANGNFGLIADDGEICREAPECITAGIDEKIVKLSSGGHHIAMLGADGNLYTCGAGEQGQLGRKPVENRRVTRSMVQAGNGEASSHKEFLLKPAVARVGRNTKLNDLWTGEFSTYCSSTKNDIYVFGLNNYSQLGIEPKYVKDNCVTDVIEKPTKTTSFDKTRWKQIAAGQHHAVALDVDGTVYTLGRSSDGRLGLGEIPADKDRFVSPTQVPGLAGKRCVQVAAGGSTSYAITADGHLYSWGFGENFQLATGDEDDRQVPFRCKGSTQGEIEHKVVLVSAGGQHAAVTISRPDLANGESKVNGKA